ncbi:MAG: NAD(P)-dependent oxidoreductase [Candidatus Dormibacteraeota bacterium]|nr:NAD(P)-dependent oxidoreductase [Candidatus Dormibacteraeota bacterium]
MAEVGYVGLGTMGGRVALRLLKAGHKMRGYNRTPERAQWLVDEGMQLCPTPRQVAESSEITFTMVTNTAALKAVVEGEDGILAGIGPGKVYIDMSTSSPDYSRELSERVRAAGGAMLDVPVSGSVSTLEEGRLSLMAGGSEQDFQRVLPVLREIGPTVNYVGTNGQAVLMKIAVNLQLAVQMVAFSEGVLLAERGGIARKTAVEVMLNSVIASPMVKYRCPFVLDMPDEAWFDVNMMQKDMLLALELGRKSNVPLPTTAVTNELLTSARALGLENKDFAVLFNALEAMAGGPQR